MKIQLNAYDAPKIRQSLRSWMLDLGGFVAIVMMICNG